MTLSETLSSSTFFHFTNSMVKLTGIITNKFEPKYCFEKTEYFTSNNFRDIEMAYPLVCFCDLPLSKVKEHISDYGSYGIGLKREWAIKNNLSPVNYTQKDASTSKNLENLMNWSLNYFENEKDTENIMLLKRIVSDFIMFSKPICGEMTRNGKVSEKKFYDEREWRWIPKIDLDNNRVYKHLEKDEYLNEEKRNYANRIIAKEYKLTFDIDDISYLIINNENEIDDFIENIEKSHDHFDAKEIKRLISKIITKDQILNDF